MNKLYYAHVKVVWYLFLTVKSYIDLSQSKPSKINRESRVTAQDYAVIITAHFTSLSYFWTFKTHALAQCASDFHWN